MGFHTRKCSLHRALSKNKLWLIDVCGLWKPIVKHPSHLLGFPILQEPGHFGIQLSELAEGGADVSVKVLVLLILVIEYSFVLLPFLHTADLWVLSVRRGSLMTAGGEIKYIYILT